MSNLIAFPSTARLKATEDIWFWFIKAQQAKAEDKLVDGPCDPGEILTILDRLYRHNRLNMDHLLILRHYGRRGIRPDATQPREQRAARQWEEAMEEIGSLLAKKGIQPAMGDA